MVIQQQPSSLSDRPQVSSMVKSRRRSVSPAEPSYRLAQALVKQEKWQEAIAAYQQALRITPNWVEVQRELGDLFLKLERWDEAVQVYETAIGLRSEGAEVYHNLGDALLKLQRWEDAIAAYQKAIELNPEFSWSYNNLGDGLRELQRWDQAAQSYQKAIELKPDFALSHHNLGDILVKKEDWKGAIAAYQKAVDLDPNFVWSYYNLAEVSVKLDQWDEAVEEYRQVLNIKPDLTEVEEKLNQALHQQVKTRLETALSYYRKAIENDPTDVESYQKALEIKPDDVDLYLGLGNAWHQKMEYQKARDTYQRLLLIQPDLEEAHKNLAQILITIENSVSETISDLDSSQKVSPIPINNTSHNNLNSVQSIYLGNDTLLLIISGCINFKEDLKIWVNDRQIQQINFEKILQDQDQIYYTFILSDVKAFQISNEPFLINIQDLSDFEILSEEISPLPNEQLIAFLDSLVLKIELKKILLFFINTLDNLKLSSNHEYYQIIAKLRQHLPQYPKLTIDYGCWLSPNVVYFETIVEGCWILETTKILLLANDICQVTPAHFFQISPDKIAAIAIFNQEIYNQNYQSYELIVIFDHHPILIDGTISQKAYGLEFIDYLNSLSEHQRILIRDTINWSLIEVTPKFIQKKVRKIIDKLQYFIKFKPTSLMDSNLPVNIFIDHFIPIGCEGVALWGWFHDSHHHLESIEVFSDLGFSIEINRKDIYNFNRTDVNEYIAKTRYQSSNHPLGFCAYIKIPDEIHHKLDGLAELHSFRFKFKFKGNIEITIIPDAKYYDVFTSRNMILQIAPPDKITDETLEKCLGVIASKLQRICMQKVEAKEFSQIKPSLEKPLASLIIPLYKQLDFVKVQLATMANDQDIQQAEIIYVLDSPEQEQEVKNLLQNYNLIYDLPIKLVVMDYNSGYASANNIGAIYAESEYLVLMNSDVFPKSKGWLSKMLKFYSAYPQIGALAPKLIYEDQSLQHAGMFFEKTTFPFWVTAHYYKGFPDRYQPAQRSRRVPAVTGACLMIKKDLYQQIGGYTTEYIIGDFEDSDLCFKCSELGYESWYFAEVELYHLERQSMVLNNDFSGTLSWRYNAWLHHRKWQSHIEIIMKNISNN
ncbi:UDP-N-acetylglucosamine--peptide N-acetylglucosaminyltransferase 110 kDa subunit [Planktothrix agardhii]|uniref:tetratricopeptide repeat protein n=1 Tax=Planktothrix agardhii TaxID=1160 RepID=UPI0020A7FBC9|nr:tetratricopeptide repeat protein [Planktothrix agardhii]CAD5915773.1 UDP-N-acetylglucosamine--peptide N-acetylglucosaminyltransferase 110 kDa subunit [Planktothrix agardhii]